MKMEFSQEFNRIMEITTNLALATAENNAPNVRIMTFYYDTQKKGVVYISTFNKAPKTLGFSQNNKVAFTTIPVGTGEFVRVTNATVQKSDLTVYDLKDGFIRKFPEYEARIAQAGAMLDIYEIHFKEASIILGFGKQGKVTL